MAGAISAQTLTDVINEFNTGVEKLNNQEYEVSIEHFNQVLAMAEVVGDEAADMKTKAEEQIPSTYYRQATLFLKRRQFDNAIPFLESTIESSTLYNNNEEIKGKASNYLLQSYMREGQRNYKNKVHTLFGLLPELPAPTYLWKMIAGRGPVVEPEVPSIHHPPLNLAVQRPAAKEPVNHELSPFLQTYPTGGPSDDDGYPIRREIVGSSHRVPPSRRSCQFAELPAARH